jgi:hypothetical protein
MSLAAGSAALAAELRASAAFAAGQVVELSAAEIAAVKAGVAAKLGGARATFDLGFVGHTDAAGTVTVCGYVKSPKLTARPEEKPFIGTLAKGGFKVAQIAENATEAQRVKSACQDKGIELLA